MKTQVDLKALTPELFASLGAPDVVYIRTVRQPDGENVYAMHAADGARLAVIDSYREAIATALANELQPVSVH